MIDTKSAERRLGVLLVTGTLVLGLQSCGSSGSDSGVLSDDSAVDTIFVDPADAATLSTALTTGEGPGDENEFWRCTLDSNGLVLAYRLFADGSGSETDLANPTARSGFTWQTTSASTMTTTVTSNGVQNMLTDIQFAGMDAMSMVLAVDGSTLACNRQGNEPVETVIPVSNSLAYGSTIYPLTDGLEIELLFRPTTQADTHWAAEFAVADARFVSTDIDDVGLVDSTFWRPDGASVWLSVFLYSPGERFESGTFEYVPDSTDVRGPQVAGRFFFINGELGIDIDEDGGLQSEEFFDIVDGAVSVNRTGEFGAQMSFDVALEDGVNVSGSFIGSFPVF